MNAKESAHWLAENFGWSVFPVRADKTPIPGFPWKLRASDSHDEIDGMPWEGAAFAAVYCGKSGISVLDIDTQEGRIELQRMMGGLPSTMQQQTPRGGTHLIFSAPVGFEQSIGTGIPCEGVDIRSGGGYIVWYGMGDGVGWDIMPWPFPAPIQKRAPQKLPVQSAAPVFGNSEGGRNNATASEAGSIMAANPATTLASLIDQLLRYNERCNSPPLETWEVEKTARSIFLKAAESAPEAQQVEVSVLDLGDIARKHMEPTRFVCAPFVAEGYTLYVGNPKIGKTTLMRQLAVAAHTGGEFLGHPCKKSGVLFLSLEEGQKLFRKKVLGMGYHPTDLNGLRVAFDWPSGEAGLNKLRDYVRSNPDTRLIIVDGMARIKGHQHDRKASVFDVDYLEGRKLQEFAKEHPGLALIVIHHTRKMESLNPMDLVSGSNGVTAAADMVCVLHRAPGGQFVMHWEGREWEEDENDYEICRDSGRWRFVGPMLAQEASLPANATRQAAILRLLMARGEMSGKAIARELDVDETTVSKACKSLLQSGAISKGSIGWTL